MEKTHKYLPGTTFIPLSRNSRGIHTITDVLTTRNLSGEIHHIRYAASHQFIGQTITERDVVETTVDRGIVTPVLNPSHPSQIAARFADTFARMEAAGMPEELKPYVESGVLDASTYQENGRLRFMLESHAADNEIIILTWYHPDFQPDAETLFTVECQRYRDNNLNDPLGTETLEPTTLEELIDYLDYIPE